MQLHRSRVVSRMLVSLLATVSAALPCRALHSRHHIAVRAWSTSGNAVLLHERVDGPEGGGSSAFWILDTDGGVSSTWELSSDFSPGDGSTPQTVSVGECRRCAAEMKGELDRRGFGMAVKVDPAGCATEERGTVVSGLPHRRTHKDSPWRVTADSAGLLTVTTSKDTVVLQGAVARPGSDCSLSVGPEGRMFLVFARNEDQTCLLGAWRCDDGDIGSARLLDLDEGCGR